MSKPGHAPRVSRKHSVIAGVAMIALMGSLLCGASVRQSTLRGRGASADELTLPLKAAPHGRDSRFTPIQPAEAAHQCSAFRPPRPIAVPNAATAGSADTVLVDFIVSRSGSVETLLIVQGADARTDRKVEDIVRSWRYEPALCNGSPVEAEGRVEVRVR